MIVPDHCSRHHGDSDVEATTKLRTLPLYVALRGLVGQYLADCDPLTQIVCDYSVSCTCVFDALVRRDARNDSERSVSVFECTFPQPYLFGTALHVRVFGHIEHHGSETLLLKCLGSARCGADGCACFNLQDPTEAVAPDALLSSSSASSSSQAPLASLVIATESRQQRVESRIPIPLETAASVVFWCGEVQSVEQQVLRCRRLLLARRDAVDRVYRDLMASVASQARADRQKDLAALESLIAKLYLPQHSADTVARPTTMTQSPLYATLSSNQHTSLSFTAIHGKAYKLLYGICRLRFWSRPRAFAHFFFGGARGISVQSVSPTDFVV